MQKVFLSAKEFKHPGQFYQEALLVYCFPLLALCFSFAFSSPTKRSNENGKVLCTAQREIVCAKYQEPIDMYLVYEY